MFIKGEYNNQFVDNTTEKEVTAWIELLKEINPASVMLYTIARNTPAKDLFKISDEKLNEIADLVKENGLKAQVF
jgi:wyosine [tRNA(Phe)-imidazoG37] synthetase (radical SAM superfamily)